MCSTRFPPQPDSERARARRARSSGSASRPSSALREQNRGGPKWSFIDGPVTANKKLAVHTAWGRTLKDVFQRYKALRGFDQRYQNGFDCQGLWIEVGVERAARLQLEARDRGVRPRGVRRAAAARSSSSRPRSSPAGCIRLGQWMDWGNDYFTFSDTNIEYIWRFLKIVNERGWLYLGHRATAWCPRCGTSLSQHELTQSGVYQEKSDPSLFVRFPLLDRPGESVVIWTTTPWTLPANVAAAVNPEGEYGLRENGEWVLASRFPDDTFVRRVPGLGARRAALRGAVRQPRAGRGRRASGRPVGRGLARGGHRDRPYRDRLRPRGLRARPLARAADAHARSTRRATSTTTTAGCTGSRRSRPPTRSSATSPSAASSSRPARTCTTTRTAGAATRRSSTASPTTGSSRSRACGPGCSRRTRRSSGCPSTWASGWTTGCATWATGTSRAAATTGCRCRSTAATAAI